MKASLRTSFAAPASPEERVGNADPRLRNEAVFVTRYLIGAEPAPELIDRYCRANQELGCIPTDADQAFLEFAGKHPWSLPYLDSALGLLDTRNLLRKKILIMMAILETTPAYVDQTEQIAAGKVRIAAELVRGGLLAGASTLLGAALCGYVRWTAGKR